MLIRPDVTENKYWKKGKLSFADKEEQYVFMPFSRVDGLLFLNTEYVKPEEIRNYKDLLDPKWQGKIATEDPTVNGRGNARAIQLYAQFGPDFIKKLFIDQKPAISRDRRQITDWLARGSHPICLTCRSDDAAALQKEGYKLVEMYELADTKNVVHSSPFLITVANKAPHPNAAAVFVNWLAGKEGLELYSRGYSTVTLRTDIDESFLDPRLIPKAGVKYQDEMELQTVGEERRDASTVIREVLKEIK
jgi:iron(III) transport system substrate-binding protein